MALFSFFKTQKPKEFNFKPRFYDAKKEHLKELMERHKADSKSSPDAMKSRISFGLKSGMSGDRNYESKVRKKSNRIFLIVLAILFVLAYLLLSKYSSDIIKFAE